MHFSQVPGDRASENVPEQARQSIEDAIRRLDVFDTKYAGKPYDWKGEHELLMAKARLLTATTLVDVTTLIEGVKERLSVYKRVDDKSLNRAIE